MNVFCVYFFSIAPYKADNKAQLERFEKAVEVINRSKNPDGTLPKAVDLNLEIERYEKLKEQIEARNLKVLSELKGYENVDASLDVALADKKIEKQEKMKKGGKDYLLYNTNP